MDFRLRSISTIKCNDRWREYVQREHLESNIIAGQQLHTSLRRFFRDRVDGDRMDTDAIRSDTLVDNFPRY